MKTRHLPTVIDDMLRVIPAGKTIFIKHLKNIKEVSAFVAPEIMGLYWQKTSELLETNLQYWADIEKGSWQDRICKIWSNNPNWREDILGQTIKESLRK